MKKILPIFVVVVLVVGGGAFYGGMKYQESKTGSGFQNFSNLTAAQRQQRLQQIGASGGFAGRTGGQSGTGLAAGQIISKDNNSITLKLQSGGSEIVFYSASTTIEKTTSGAPSDLTVGQNVVANGTANQDGSINAQSIQLRPAAPQQPQGQ